MRLAFLLLTLFPVALLAQPVLPSLDEILPPNMPWSGRSESIVVPANDPWITPSERNGLTTSPSYDETVAWLRKLVAAAPQLRMVSLGKSPEGRDIWMVIASKERRFTPEGLRSSGKPTLLAQAGIHSGEIDGKDAGMMLLRDMTVRGTEKQLLDHANFLFVPIFSVDAHERSSRFSRINQRGPEISGWRTNARNLNLNRDYMKADTLEMRAMLGALDRWQPDLYLDIHVTDGADYQYDITFGFNGRAGWSPAIGAWLETVYQPAVNRDLAQWGHIPGPLVFGRGDLSGGIVDWVATPRFSNGYGDARHLPTVLFENHSLKPYRQRVLGTWVALKSSLERIGAHRETLREAIAQDRSRNAATVPLEWKSGDVHQKIEFLGIESNKRISPISGAVVIDWVGKPVTMSIPYMRPTEVAKSVSRPRAYWIPPGWPEVIERLAAHGVRMERITEPRTVKVGMVRLQDPKFEPEPFEGHIRVVAETATAGTPDTWTFPVNSVRVPTDQPLGTIAVLLLEPSSGDSFFQWGFMLEPLSQTEYFEEYAMEPIARRMLESDPALAHEFMGKLERDSEFRSDARARLHWFYERTPYFDTRWRLYPIGREMGN
jgi:hypothetical protein